MESVARPACAVMLAAAAARPRRQVVRAD